MVAVMLPVLPACCQHCCFASASLMLSLHLPACIESVSFVDERWVMVYMYIWCRGLLSWAPWCGLYAPMLSGLARGCGSFGPIICTVLCWLLYCMNRWSFSLLDSVTRPGIHVYMHTLRNCTLAPLATGLLPSFKA